MTDKKAYSRRAALAAGGAAALASGLPVVAQAGAHPDAGIIGAWEEYKSRCNALRTVDIATDEEGHALCVPIWALEKQIIQATAKTGDGLAIKLRLYWRDYRPFTEASGESFGKDTPPADAFEGPMDKMIWEMIAQAEAIGRGRA